MNKPTIANLKIEQYCGSGAYGDVWIAEDLSGVKRAVKVLNKARLKSMGVLQKEQKALSLFRQFAPTHPHLINIYHVGENESNIYYIMELGDSGNPTTYEPDTLEFRLKNKVSFSEKEIVALTLDILDAVKALHSVGLVHRDIKPSNVIYCNNVVKLADIGLVASDSTNLSFGGTQYFIPPDQTMGKQADLYATGKMLYCLFTGLPAQYFPTLPECIVEKMTPERKLINRIISKACAKKESMRFSDVSEFITALKGENSNVLSQGKRKLFLYAILLLIGFSFIGIGGFVLKKDNLAVIYKKVVDRNKKSVAGSSVKKSIIKRGKGEPSLKERSNPPPSPAAGPAPGPPPVGPGPPPVGPAPAPTPAPGPPPVGFAPTPAAGPPPVGFAPTPAAGLPPVSLAPIGLPQMNCIREKMQYFFNCTDEKGNRQSCDWEIYSIAGYRQIEREKKTIIYDLNKLKQEDRNTTITVTATIHHKDKKDDVIQHKYNVGVTLTQLSSKVVI